MTSLMATNVLDYGENAGVILLLYIFSVSVLSLTIINNKMPLVFYN